MNFQKIIYFFFIQFRINNAELILDKYCSLISKEVSSPIHQQNATTLPKCTCIPYIENGQASNQIQMKCKNMIDVACIENFGTDCQYYEAKLEDVLQSIHNVNQMKLQVSKLIWTGVVVENGSIPVGFFKKLNGLKDLDLSSINDPVKYTDRSFEGLENTLINLTLFGGESFDLKVLKTLKKLARFEIYLNHFQNITSADLAGLNNLKVLALRATGIEFIEKDTFKNCPKLRDLDFYNNRLNETSIPAFKNLTSLEILYLTSNKFETIEDNWFEKMTNLKFLSFGDNSIHTISENAFKGLSKLETLDISQTYSSTNIHGKALYPLHNLKQLFLGDIRLVTINGDMFSSQKNSLKWMDLKYNSFTAINRNTFFHLLSLEYLNLAQNQIRTVEENAFENLTKLTYLDLSENQFAILPKGIFLPLKNLEFLDLSGNQLEIVPESVYSLINLTALNLTGNKISKIRRNDFNNLRKLVILRLERNSIKFVEDDSFSNLTNLEELNLKGNLIEVISLKTFNLPKLNLLNLYDNNILKLAANIFSHLSMLETLWLDFNKNLTFIDPTAFYGLANVKELSLSDTGISYLPESIFQTCTNLVSVILDNTNLRSLTFKHFKNNPKLERLQLRNLTLDEFLIDIVKLPNLKQIYVFNSKFDCNKNLTVFIGFLRNQIRQNFQRNDPKCLQEQPRNDPRCPLEENDDPKCFLPSNLSGLSLLTIT